MQGAQTSPRSRVHSPAAESSNSFQFSPEKPPGPRYPINVEPLSGIKPPMFAVDFERPSGGLAFTVVVLAMCPKHAMEQVFEMFPEYRRESRQGHVHEVAHVEIDWQAGRAFVMKRRKQPMLLLDVEIRRKRSTGGRKKGQG